MANALLIIDMQQFVQQRIDQGVDTFPHQAIENGLSILNAYRQQQRPVIHIYHHDLDSTGTLHPDQAAAMPLEGFQPLPNEKFFIKHGSSALSHTGLYSHLMTEGISHLTVIGAVAGFCVNSTVRAAADLGLSVTIIDDAVVSFALAGTPFNAELLWQSTLALLAADFAVLSSLTQWRSENENSVE